MKPSAPPLPYYIFFSLSSIDIDLSNLKYHSNYYMDQFTQQVVFDIFTALSHEQPYKGMEYSKFQLYGTEFDDTVDANAALRAESISIQYPGGFPGARNITFGTFALEAVTSPLGQRQSIQIQREKPPCSQQRN
jgi:hypothetical protein